MFQKERDDIVKKLKEKLLKFRRKIPNNFFRFKVLTKSER